MVDSPFFRVYNGVEHLESRKVVGFYNKYLSDMNQPLLSTSHTVQWLQWHKEKKFYGKQTKEREKKN